MVLAHQLKQWEFSAIDCQVKSEHLLSMGAEEITRDRFMQLLESSCTIPDGPQKTWQLDINLDETIASP